MALLSVRSQTLVQDEFPNSWELVYFTISGKIVVFVLEPNFVAFFKSVFDFNSNEPFSGDTRAQIGIIIRGIKLKLKLLKRKAESSHEKIWFLRRTGSLEN